jgi:mono/diheme cytochrome c family protein
MLRFEKTANRIPVLCFALVAVACHTGTGEGLDTSAQPANVRADYEVFAQRCSKCHALARPLESGITDDAYWAEYVERMRRQPGSGISPADVPPILRFLHYYSSDQRRRKHARESQDGGK